MKNKLFIFISVILSVLQCNMLTAQTGPASIGNNDGSNGQPKNLLWLDAGSLALSNGSEVTAWTDKSGNAISLGQSGLVGVGNPTFVTGAINSLPAVKFSSSGSLGSALVKTGFTNFPTANISTIVVYKTDASETGDGILSYATAGGVHSNEYSLLGSNNLSTYVEGNNVISSKSFNDGNFNILTSRWSTSQGVFLSHNGDADAHSTNSVTGITLSQGGALAIGNEQDDVNAGYSSGQALDGEIAEIIIYDAFLNDAQKIIIENYLQAKYGITIDKDYFSNTTHTQDLAGIGQEANGNQTSAHSKGFYLTSASDLDDGEYLMFAHNKSVVNSVSISDCPTSVEQRWAKDWFLEKTGSLGAKITFDFPEGIEGFNPKNIENYVLLYRSGTTGDYSIVNITASNGADIDQVDFQLTNSNLQTGYYTLGSKDASQSPVKGENTDGNTWYALASGNWSDHNIWTLDPAGILYKNPNSYYPTSANDKIVIRSGKDVKMDLSGSNYTFESVTVDGSLDLQSKTGLEFKEIKGSGRILMSADVFPDFTNADHFIKEGQGEGTVVVYGNSFSYNAKAHEFYNFEVKMTAGQTFTLLKDLSLNGNLKVETGTMQINDNSSTTPLNITVYKNIDIFADAAITTGTANARHQLNVYGDFTNFGQVAFTNRTNPVQASYYLNEATDGVVDFNALNAKANQSILCKNATNFYRIEINKGTDKTYILSINADDAAYFNLLGYAGENHSSSSSQLDDSENALALLKGTVKIGANVNIPVLSTNGNYNISDAACLWVDGGKVEKNSSGVAIMIYGTARISSGIFNAKCRSGFTLRSNGLIKVEGGEINTNQIRTSILGSSNVGAYIQSGGTVNVITPNKTNADYYHFSLTYPGNVFNMSGGTLRVEGANGDDTNSGGIFIASDPENVNVTGGTVEAVVTTSDPFKITSKAPFWNLDLINNMGSTNTIAHILDGGSNINGNDDADLPAQPLVVLNDLTINSNALLDHKGNDVTIGRNFTIAENAQQRTFVATGMDAVWNRYNYGYVFDQSKPNTLTFNSNKNAVFYQGYNVDSPYELFVSNLVINKTEGAEVLIDGNTNKEAGHVTNGFHNRLIYVRDTIDIQNGTLNQGLHSIRLYGQVKVSSTGELGVYEHGVTKTTAYLMLRGDNTKLLTENGAILGNLKLNPANSNIVSLESDVYIKRIGYHVGSMNIKNHKLKVDYFHKDATTENYSWQNDNERIITSGKASDGGLELLITGNGKYFYPLAVGTSGSSKYTPAVVSVSNFQDDGYIQIRPVDEELSTLKAKAILWHEALSCYWRVGHTEFSDLPNVSYTFNYDDADVQGSNEDNYVAGKVLDEGDFARSFIDDLNSVDENNNVIYFSTPFSLERANYTAGYEQRFEGKPEVYYTRLFGNGNHIDWKDGNTWTYGDNPAYGKHDSRQTKVPWPKYPKKGDVAVIGWVPHDDTGVAAADRGKPHGVKIDGTVNFAELRFSQMLDAAGNPVERNYTNNFQFRPTLCVGPSADIQGRAISGEGLFRMRSAGNGISDPDFSNTDIGNFISQDSSYFLYECTSNDTYNNIPKEVPNLLISGDGWGNQNSDFKITSDVTVNQDLELLGNVNLVLNNGAAGDIIVKNNLKIFESSVNGNISGGGGEIAFPNNVSRTVEVFGDLQLVNAGAIVHVRNPNTTVNVSKLVVHGNIEQDNTSGGGLQLFSAQNEDYIHLELKGSGNHSYDAESGAIANLFTIDVDKGSDQGSTFTFNSDFNLNGPTSGINVPKALQLKNGTLILDNDDIDINLTTGNYDFKIPSTASLEVKQGTVNATGSSGILLDGKLLVSGGTVNMLGGDNYIKYSASGNATIEVTNGTLNVGSQVRRGLNSEEGILHYSQSGGIVNVGVSAAAQNSRGIFEISNTSTFTHTGGEFNIVNDYRTNPSIASLYFNPETATLDDATTINFGTAQTQTSENDFSIQASKPLQNLKIDNASSLKLEVEQLYLNSDLNIANNSTFDAQGLNVNIKGVFTNAGTYTASENETVFEGTEEQTISGATTFYKLTKNTGNNLKLASNSEITVEDLLSFTAGTFHDGGNNVIAKGNVHSDITSTSDVSSQGIILQGVENQEITGDGVYARLAINNGNGVKVPVGNTITVNEELAMQSGVLDIGKNLLILGENTKIIEGAAFGENNMIQTNMSFADAGIQKTFPAISSAEKFIYPIGSAGKYTPVTFNITNCSSGGYIRVIAADEIHSSVLEDIENPDPQIVDKDNVLQYHWKLDANNISNFSATCILKDAYDSDIKVTAPYTVDDYLTASLRDEGAGVWAKNSTDNYHQNTKELEFVFTNTDDLGIDGDYTAGVDAAIPDKVHSYITKQNGNWNDINTWDTYPIAGGNVPAGGPRGAIVYIKHDVITPENSHISSYTTHILDKGLVNVGNTFGHRLGTVDGTGTLYLERGELPAGRYDGFFAPDSGTVHFAGSNDYTFLSDITNVNNLILSGSGERHFPNLDLVIHGDFTIGDESDNPVVDNEYDGNISVQKDVHFKSGTFDAGYGPDAIFEMSGNQLQNISGNFTGTNAFNHLKMNSTSGLKLEGNIEIDYNLILSSGVIFSSSSHTIKLNNTENDIVTGGSDISHVDGPLFKKINQNESFEFPVGNGGRYGKAAVISSASTTAYWEVQYYNDNPSNNGYNGTIVSPLTMVSDNEYWRIKSPTGVEKAKIGLRWDAKSGMPSDKLYIAEWRPQGGPKWQQVDPNNTKNGTTSGTVVSTVDTQFDRITNTGNIFTISSTAPILDYTWTGDVSTVWENPNNWESNGATATSAPSAANDVIIPDVPNKPIISQHASCREMDLKSGATLTINPRGSLTLRGDLTMNGDITILSDASGTGSLIDNEIIKAGTGTLGTATVQRYFQGNGDRTLVFHYVSAPLATVPHTLYSITPWGVANPNFYVYNEAVDNEDMNYYWDHTAATSGTLTVGRGYALAYDRDITVDMVGGEFITGDRVYTITYNNNDNETVDGWNLIGNPYPSAISATKFINDNQSIIKGTVYFWDDDASSGDDYTSSDYATWNLAGGISGTGSPSQGGKVPDGNISCGQGFFVKAISSVGSVGKNVVFNNSMRTVGNGQFFKGTTAEQDDAVRLRVSISNEQEKMFNEAMIVFMDEATDGYDNLYDGRKSFGNNDIGFYSILNNTPYAIQSLSKIRTRKEMAKKIPMGYKITKAGSYVFTALKYENIGNEYAVFLEDKLTGKITELSEGDTYEFTSEAGTVNDRFIITFSLREEPANNAPVLRYKLADVSVDEDSNFQYAINKNSFDDIDLNDKLRYTLTLADGSAAPAWLHFDETKSEFTGTPSNDDVGKLSVKLTATDLSNASKSDIFTIEVINVNDVPELVNKIPNQSIYENTKYENLIDNVFRDIDKGDVLTYSVSLENGEVLPTWLSFDPTNFKLSGVPDNIDIGIITIKITATDMSNATVSDIYQLEVTNLNDSPELLSKISDQLVNEGDDYEVTYKNIFSDVDLGDKLSYSASLGDGSALPAWLHFNSETCTFIGRPTNEDVGRMLIKVTATDASNTSVSDIYKLEVLNVNDAPELVNKISNQQINEDAKYELNIKDVFRDIDSNDKLTYVVTLSDGSSLPNWLSFEEETLSIIGIPTNINIGSISIKIVATDMSNASASDIYDLEVVNVNDAPELVNKILNQQIYEDAKYQFKIQDNFRDIDTNDKLTYLATLADGSSLPNWLSFDSKTLSFTGMPTNDNVGIISIKIVATDMSNASASDIYELEVVNVNDAPELVNEIPDQEVTEQEEYSYVIPAGTFKDVDLEDNISISVSSASVTALPSWLKFDSETLTLYGTAANEGEIHIKVTGKDKEGAAVSDEFVLNVKKVATSIDNIDDKAKILVYPNPTIDKVFVKIDEFDQNTRFILLDYNGRKIQEKAAVGLITEIDMSNLSNGIYFIEVMAKDTKTVHRVILRK